MLKAPSGLTPKQFELLAFIDAYKSDHGATPSYDEMKNGVGLRSKSGINRLVVSLEERGAIIRMKHRARCIDLTTEAKLFLEEKSAAHPEAQKRIAEMERYLEAQPE